MVKYYRQALGLILVDFSYCPMPKHGRLSFKGDNNFVKSKKKRSISAKEKVESSQSQVHIKAKALWSCVIDSLGRPIIRVRFRVIGLGFHCLFLLLFQYFGVLYCRTCSRCDGDENGLLSHSQYLFIRDRGHHFVSLWFLLQFCYHCYRYC